MSGNQQKTPFGESISRFATSTAKSVGELVGKSLPATLKAITGSIVQLNYEVTGSQTLPSPTVPLMGSKYHRLPYQPGEKGVTLAGGAYLGGMSGLGEGTADLSQRGNLSTQFWAPLSSADWPAEDQNTHTLIGGPNGIKLKDATGAAILTMTATTISMSVGGHTLSIDSAGVHIDGRIFLLHTHNNVSSGAGTSGGVT